MNRSLMGCLAFLGAATTLGACQKAEQQPDVTIGSQVIKMGPDGPKVVSPDDSAPTRSPAVTDSSPPVPPPVIGVPPRKPESGVSTTLRPPAPPKVMETGNAVVATTPKRPEAAAPAPAPVALRTVLIRTVPSGAKVKLVANGTGQIFEGTTPITFPVPPNIYKWEIELPGYMSDRSVRNDVDVVSNQADTVSITLTRSGDVSALMARAEAAYRAQGGSGCEEAVRIYKQLPVPADVRSAQGIQWLEGQYHAGQCQYQLKEYDDAEALYAAILIRNPSQWAAKYELARTNCQTRQFSKGIQHLRELRGPFPLSADIGPAVKAIAKYGETECRYKDLQSKDQPDRFPDLREQVKGGFEEFVEGAEPLLQGSTFPVDVRKLLQESLAKAKVALQKLDGGN